LYNLLQNILNCRAIAQARSSSLTPLKKSLEITRGGYSLGISLYSKDKSRIAISICLDDQGDNSFPQEFVIGSEIIPVEVQKNYQMPIAL
jgi:hypothetical protein